MTTVLIAIYAAGCWVSWYLIAGMFFAQTQGKFPSRAAENYREDLGFSVVIGFIYSLFWPLGLPMAWCFSGFAEHGVWKTRKAQR